MKKAILLFAFLCVGAMVLPTNADAGRWVKSGAPVQESNGCVSQAYACESNFWYTQCDPGWTKFEMICSSAGNGNRNPKTLAH